MAGAGSEARFAGLSLMQLNELLEDEGQLTEMVQKMEEVSWAGARGGGGASRRGVRGGGPAAGWRWPEAGGRSRCLKLGRRDCDEEWEGWRRSRGEGTELGTGVG